MESIYSVSFRRKNGSGFPLAFEVATTSGQKAFMMAYEELLMLNLNDRYQYNSIVEVCKRDED